MTPKKRLKKAERDAVNAIADALWPAWLPHIHELERVLVGALPCMPPDLRSEVDRELMNRLGNEMFYEVEVKIEMLRTEGPLSEAS